MHNYLFKDRSIVSQVSKQEARAVSLLCVYCFVSYARCIINGALLMDKSLLFAFCLSLFLFYLYSITDRLDNDPHWSKYLLY